MRQPVLQIFYKNQNNRSEMSKWFCLMLVFMSSVSCSQKNYTGANKSIKIVSSAPVQPVFKRLSSNPLLRVGIYVPAGHVEINYDKIHGTLNADAVQAIEKLEVYFTDTEPLFSTNNPIATITPSITGFEIPVDLSLKPGWHYIWFSAVLKESADMDAAVEFHVTKLTDASGKQQAIIEEKGAYKKRIGIAVRKINDDSVHSYRIPGITTTDRGTLIAVYDIRYENSGDLPGNIDVGMSRSTDGGKTWKPMKVIMDMGAPHENNGIGDPAVLFDPVTKKIWVAALWSKGNRSIAGSEPGLSPDTTGQFVLVSSEDDGVTWSQPYSITAQVKDPKWHLYFNGPGNGIAMQNGILVFPSQYWDESKKPGMPHSAIIYSTDHGKTWKSGTGAKSNTTESQVVETTPGTLMLSMRDNRGNYRSVATTTDMGRTWTEHVTSYNTLPDPVCMASFIKANVNVNGAKKGVLFFSNPASSTARNNMTVKASLDLGEKWQAANELLIDERRGYGYSAMTKIDDNTIGLLYEGVRELYFIRIPVNEIINN
jgi:sialidase-1